MKPSTSSPKGDRLDPVVVHARREALVILAAFVVCLIWSISCCYLLGYPGPDDFPSEGHGSHTAANGPVAKVLGMPSWVFWGVLVPWVAADVFAVWFCFCFMADDPLAEAEDETGYCSRDGGVDLIDGAAGRDGSRQEDRHD